MKNELISAVDEMISSLIVSGKADTAKHFMSINNKILTTKNNPKLKVVLKRLISSGSISQWHRIVMGTDGKSYYTNNHYGSFAEL